MRISRTVVYALQAILLLAQSEAEGPVPCSRLAAQGRMPERFLLQILRNLVTHGLLVSTRGVVGGYALQRKPQDISLLDVIEAVEGPVASGLPLDAVLGGSPRARLEELLRSIAERTRRELASVKLADLLPPSRP